MILNKGLRCLSFLLILLIVFSFAIPTTTLKQNNIAANINFVKACENEFRGIWFSYKEWQSLHAGASEEEWKAKLKDNIIPNLKKFKINNVMVHATAFADSFYMSDLYPISNLIKNNEGNLTYDPFRVMLNMLTEKGIKVHAWLNPLRAMTDSRFEKISDKYQTKIWYNSKNRHRFFIKDSSKRYWLNPANEEVRTFLKKVVEEILRKYKNIEGIHIDDYFYPTGLPSENSKKSTVLMDDVQYYNEIKPNVSLSNWRRNSVTAFVKDFYNICVKHKKIFGISPQGNFDNNLNSMFFNQKEIVSKGYAHYLMPQIYYGFKNKTCPFEKTCKEWSSLISKNKNMKLYIGLAAYRLCLKGDNFAVENGEDEHFKHGDILKRQVETIRNIKTCNGFCLFSYNSLFSNKNTEGVKEEKLNYLKLFKNKKINLN